MAPALFHAYMVQQLGLRNNVVCQATAPLSLLAALQINQVAFDYVVAFGVLESWTLQDESEVEAVLSALMQIAPVVLLDLPVSPVELFDGEVFSLCICVCADTALCVHTHGLQVCTTHVCVNVYVFMTYVCMYMCLFVTLVSEIGLS